MLNLPTDYIRPTNFDHSSKDLLLFEINQDTAGGLKMLAERYETDLRRYLKSILGCCKSTKAFGMQIRDLAWPGFISLNHKKTVSRNSTCYYSFLRTGFGSVRFEKF